jgi:hypothetical protein
MERFLRIVAFFEWDSARAEGRHYHCDELPLKNLFIAVLLRNSPLQAHRNDIELNSMAFADIKLI